MRFISIFQNGTYMINCIHQRKKGQFIMSTLKTPFRYDFVGSFLRPQILKDSKEKLKTERYKKTNTIKL